MKIALVILHADASRGGAERYTVDLAGALAANPDHSVYLIASSLAAALPEGVIPVSLPTSGFTRVGQYRGFLKSLDEHLAHSSYDVIHAMLPVRRCTAYHPHAGLAADAVENGHHKYDPGVRRSMARIANRINRKRQTFAEVERELLGSDPPMVLCLSEYIKRTVRKCYPRLATDRLATLFNAVDLVRFDRARDVNARSVFRQKYDLEPDKPVALIIAQDFARKGLREAIAATAAVKEVTLLVVGRDDPAPCQRQAEELGVSDRIRFLGPTPDPYPFYAGADFFVLPTRHDPCSLVVLEALAMGLPVVSTVFNGACEIMTDGVHGRVLMDPADVSVLADAMRHLSDPEICRAASEACLSLRPRLSFTAHVERLLSIYKSAKA